MIDPKKQIRPTISSIQPKENISIEEKFQNEVLRPIIKMQHELIIASFEHHLILNKIRISEQSDSQKKDLIQKIFKQNNRLKTDLIALIIGLFTLEEYLGYLSLTSQINKRIYSIIHMRIISIYVE